MQTGTRISAIGHGALIAAAVFGLPWFGPREREPIRVTEVSFVSEAEFEAARSAETPPEADAPPEPPAAPPPEPAPEAEPEPEPSDAAPEVASIEPPAATLAPEAPDRIVPKVVTLAPPTAAAPPRPRPAPRVEPVPTPPSEAVREAETPTPEAAPTPEPDAVEEEAPAAPAEAAPVPEEAEPTPAATLALITSARPLARRGNVRATPAAPEPDATAEAVMAAVRQQARESNATPPTPATAPTPAAPAEPAEAEASSLPMGPPISSSEKEGLKLAVQRCWNVPAGVRDAQELKVTLAAELAADGAVINASIRMIEPRNPPDARFQQAFEAGRRALIRCSPYELPREKYGQWRNIEVVFNPEGMVSW
jgi:hypothetical protein